MSRPIIEVENLSKRYRLGQFTAQTMREEVEQFFARFRNRGAGRGADISEESSEFWALKDVSFSVQPGEVVGIIGRNGAGKSTLLKIMSRVTEPSMGQARLRGRVAALLEVGTGFHHELTGRENIYLNGAILGMTRAEIRNRFDEIVAFAEIDRFLDTPVKRYSSGMYVRLAFAVAAHLEPEILIVDEVLAVGDAEFQKKCLGKMRSVSTDRGRTVLFVSHNMTAVASLCRRALMMDAGRIERAGPVKEIIDHYLASSVGIGDRRRKVWSEIDAPGDERVKVARVEIVADTDDPGGPIDMATPLRIEVDYWNLVPGANLIVELIVRASDGAPVFHSFSNEADEAVGRPHPKGLFGTVCHIPGELLNEGCFLVEVHFLHGRTSDYFSLIDAGSVTVFGGKARPDHTYHGRFVGPVHPKLMWKTALLAHDRP